MPPRPRLWHLLLGLTLATGAGAADEPGPTLYQQAVHILGGNGNVVSRWHEPIRFVAVGFDDTTLAHHVVADAASYAGLDVSFPVEKTGGPGEYLELLKRTPPYAMWSPCGDNQPRACVNFVVLRTDAGTMQKVGDTMPLPAVHLGALAKDPNLACFFYPFRDGRLRIRQAFVFINEALDAPMTATCLNEEIYQAFGMFGDYTGSSDFSFNNVVAPKDITVYDRLLLTALYDERVSAGLPVHHVATLFLDYAKQFKRNEETGD